MLRFCEPLITYSSGHQCNAQISTPGLKHSFPQSLRVLVVYRLELSPFSGLVLTKKSHLTQKSYLHPRAIMVPFLCLNLGQF